MALTITVNGGGTFTASMEEGPVSFTASLAAVGPAGPGVAAGGTEGQILVKTSGQDYATGWIDNSARSSYITARNSTGTAIAKGKVVYLSGATGNKPTITLAQANSEVTSARTIGITKAEIANGADGDVIILGAIEGLDTSAFSAGDSLYLSETTAGGLRVGLPTQPNHGVFIGIVTRSHPSLGSIEVAIQNYQELSELSDVLLASKTNLDLLSWDSATSVWKNKSFATLGLLTSASAASTYLTISNAAATYLSQTAASTDYLSKAGNLSGLADASVARSNLALGPSDSVSFGSLFKGTVTGEQYSISPNAVWAGKYNGVSVTKTELSDLGVTFPDATVQATKGLIPASNLSDLASASTARTNLGLGTMATETASDYLTKAGNLSGLASTSTARTNLGLGTMATETASDYLTKAGNLSGLASNATARTNLDVYSKSESDALVPAASTTAAGKVELATDAEARAATSSSVVVTPASFPWLAVRPGFRSLAAVNATIVSGSGSVSAASGQSWGSREMFLASLATGRAAFRFGETGVATRGFLATRATHNRIDFSKKIWMAGTVTMGYTVGATSYLGDANTVARIMLGGSETSTADLSAAGIAIKKVGGVSSFVTLSVHNGTTLTDVATTYQNADGENFEWVIYSNGSGTVTLWINGSQAATTNNGPTGLGVANQGTYVEQVYAASTPGVRHAMQSAASWLYIES